MSIQITEDKFYKDANGDKRGPVVCGPTETRFWVQGHGRRNDPEWSPDGKALIGGVDLIAEWVEPCALGSHFRGADNSCTICGATPEQVNEQAREAMLPSERLDVLTATQPPSLHIYLSGPMSGYPKANYPLFHAVATMLRHAGHTVYNPAEFEHNGPIDAFPLRRAFAEYAKFICEEADALVLLPAWEASLGVSAELALAKNCKLQIIEFQNLKIALDSPD